MKYELEIKSRALKDLRRLDSGLRTRVIRHIEALRDDVKGDVKRLTNYSPKFRLRIGEYRVLFEIVEDKIEIHRIRNRSELY